MNKMTGNIRLEELHHCSGAEDSSMRGILEDFQKKSEDFQERDEAVRLNLSPIDFSKAAYDKHGTKYQVNGEN